MKVAFIGLGNMGQPMARNILRAGHELTVYNRTSEKATPLAQAGARVADTPCQAAQGAEVVCFCVSTPDVARTVVLGDEGSLNGASPGAIFVDFSTIDPATSRELSRACSTREVQFLDGPVSGGMEGAASGKLTVMIGGDRAAVESVRPVLEAVGENIAYIGPSGLGSTVKLINQMLVGVNLAAVCEAFVAGKLAGIDPELLYKVLSTSAGSSTMLTRSVPNYVLKGNFEAGFAVDLLSKDLDLVLRMGKDLNASLFTPAVASQIYRAASALGLGKQDMASAILPMEQMHGVEVRGDGSREA